MGESDLVNLCKQYPTEFFDVKKASIRLGLSIRSIQRTLKKLKERKDVNITIIMTSTGYLFWRNDYGESRQTTRCKEN
ncbi:MAG: hypothetical protein BWY21_00263 [Parcubacteria group bacterium ADurb.Bin216]|nr:MAG: hypothetical protein BWY21_00263 [Parcubacteria group bacterium ADurb.Bin216]